MDIKPWEHVDYAARQRSKAFYPVHLWMFCNGPVKELKIESWCIKENVCKPVNNANFEIVLQRVKTIFYTATWKQY